MIKLQRKKSKRTVLFSLFLVAILMFLVVGCSAGNSDNNISQDEQNTQNSESDQGKKEQQVITLKLADTFPVTHPMNKVTKEAFIKPLEESGKVKIEYYPAGQLGKAEDMLELVKGGGVDIAYVSPGFVGGSLPLSTVISLPNMFNNPIEGTEIYYQLSTGILSSEFDKHGVKPIFVSLTPPYEIITTKKQVIMPEDIKGMKIRGGGGQADITLDILGATVVSLPSADIYEAMQKGVIDGASINYTSGHSYRLDEMAKYGTIGANVGSLSTTHLINKQKFDSLPEDVQQLLIDVGRNASIEAGKMWDIEDKSWIDEFKNKGGTIHILTDEEKAKWKESTRSAAELWVKDLESKGFDSAGQVYDEMNKIANQVVK